VNPAATPAATATAIVTGAGSGIGRATALGLADAGYRVALVGRTEAKLTATAEMIEARASAAERAHVIAADLAEPDAARRVVDEVRDRFARIDALVNNAGVAELAPVDEHTRAMLQRMLAVNTVAVGELIILAWPVMASQTRLEGVASPAIVNVSTAGTRDPFPGFFGYAASKAAVESFVRSIANEAGDTGIRAFAVAPGATETPMLRSLFSEQVLPKSATAPPETVAEAIVDCVQGGRDAEIGRTLYL